MEDITLGQISAAFLFLGGLIGSAAYIHGVLKGLLTTILKKQLKPLQEQIDEVDRHSTKNFLVSTLAGVENGETLCKIEEQRFWEQYEHYKNKGGNSYVERKVEQLKAEGKL